MAASSSDQAPGVSVAHPERATGVGLEGGAAAAAAAEGKKVKEKVTFFFRTIYYYYINSNL